MDRRTRILLLIGCLVGQLILAPNPARADLLAPLSDGQRLDLPPLNPEVPSPAAFLGYPLGTHFTHHHRIVAYLERLAASSPRVSLWTYGTTYEGRPLQLLAITAPENQTRLEEIRQDNLKLAGAANLSPAERNRLVERAPVVVWLAYGVHGNESSAAEAAMATAYVLAAGEGEVARMLEGMVVLLDPLSNPDGRERYVHAYEQRRGSHPDPYPQAAEHWEPWPGGRQNHYLIDLNRDWAWATQEETRHRLAAYQAWEPQVYVDFHEMGRASTYFFPPSAEPIHPAIDPRVVKWLEVFGQANAQALDGKGWIYYVGEEFDLFYPGYGDSYPSLRGAVGMTYEMAGGGRAGLTVTLPDGGHLTLADRIARHFTTSLATVRTAARNRQGLLANFAAAREANAQGESTTYLWEPDQGESWPMAELLLLHGIEVQQLAEPAELPIRSLGGQEVTRKSFPRGTFLVSTAQPLGSLVRSFMELHTPMSNRFLETQRKRFEENLRPEFYDITSWSLPLAYNVETWVLASPLQAPTAPVASRAGGIEGRGEVGFLLPPNGLATYRVAAALQRLGIRHRWATADFDIDGGRYPRGTLFIPRTGNPENLEGILLELCQSHSLKVLRVASAYSSRGISLGSDRMVPVRPAQVALVGGEGIDPTSHGFLWHLLDEGIKLRPSRLDLSRLHRVDLSRFNVLVLPDGRGYRRLEKEVVQAVDRWVRAGGVLVAVGEAVRWVGEQEWTSIKAWEPPKEEGEAGSPQGTPAERPIHTPGAAVRTVLRTSHPLTAGIATSPAVLVQGSLVLLPTGDPQRDLLTVRRQDPVVSGFAWPEAQERLAGSLLMATETRDRGRLVLFAHNPAFRLFWRATMPLFLNAVIFGPSLGAGD